MVSACAYSGAYPTGYGMHRMSTEGVPPRLYDDLRASGFTHFQQSGTGAIRKYYNYFRVTPMVEPLDALDTLWALEDEVAEPGYYSATMSSGIRAELTVGPKSAVHRYTFPSHDDARVVVDLSLGGLAIEHGRTVPMRARLAVVAPGEAQGEIVVEGVPLSVHIECDAARWRQMLFYDRRLMAGGSKLEFDSIRLTTLRSFGLVLIGPTDVGEEVELRMGFSLRGVEQAKENLHRDCGAELHCFDTRRASTQDEWRAQLDRIAIETSSSEQRTIFATSLYHSLIKPCYAPDESPFWTTSRSFVFDISTMWDLYKTQLPLLTLVAPDRAVELVAALLSVKEEEGNFPIGYRMARGTDRFFRQGSALAHTFFADVCELGLPGIDWEYVLVHLHDDLRRNYGEDFLEKGVAHPITHTLDLAYGYHCTARVARHVGDDELADHLDALAEQWRRRVRCRDRTARRLDLLRGRTLELLVPAAPRHGVTHRARRWRGVLRRDARPVLRLRRSPRSSSSASRHSATSSQPATRSTGSRASTTSPTWRSPWAYHYAGRPDRTTEVVHAVGAPGVRPRSWRPARQRRLRRAQLLVRVGVARTVPRRRPEPLPGERAGVRPLPHPRRRRRPRDRGRGPRRARPVTGPQYVQSVTLDGEPLERSWLTSRQLHRPGRLVVRLGAEPSDWGTRARPPSTPSSGR